ncbi:MAG: septum formation initiator family protein [bacterium]|nr:septum formation initiator family protein [bacterium]
MKNKDSNSSWKIGSVIFLAIIIFGFLSFSLYKEFSKKKMVENEIEALKEQAEKIKQENMSLEERIAYLGSQDYQKIQAKDKLDLQDPNENVVVITQDLDIPTQKTEESNTSNNVQHNYSQEKTSNFLKWWNYFIK